MKIASHVLEASGEIVILANAIYAMAIRTTTSTMAQTETITCNK